MGETLAIDRPRVALNYRRLACNHRSKGHSFRGGPKRKQQTTKKCCSQDMRHSRMDVHGNGAVMLMHVSGSRSKTHVPPAIPCTIVKPLCTLMQSGLKKPHLGQGASCRHLVPPPSPVGSKNKSPQNEKNEQNRSEWSSASFFW